MFSDGTTNPALPSQRRAAVKKLGADEPGIMASFVGEITDERELAVALVGTRPPTL